MSKSHQLLVLEPPAELKFKGLALAAIRLILVVHVATFLNFICRQTVKCWSAGCGFDKYEMREKVRVSQCGGCE